MPSRPQLHMAAARQVLRRMTGRERVVLTGRGAAGIYAALVAWEMQGKVVLLPANTCYIVLWAVMCAGAIPQLVDVDPNTGNVSLESFKSYMVDRIYPHPLTPSPSERGGINQAGGYKPSVLIPCHMYGLPAPMGEIMVWAREQGVRVIEDAALALGAMVEGKPAGAWGDAAIFSFGLGKTVDNEIGGAFLTDDAALAEAVDRVLAGMPLWNDDLLEMTEAWHTAYWELHQGEPDSARQYLDYYERYGALTAYRLPASYWRDVPDLLVDLKDNLAHRMRLSALYDELLLSISGFKTFARPAEAGLWRYPLLVPPDERDDLLDYLWAHEVDATRWYPSLSPMLKALAPHFPVSPTPNADLLSASIINLPLDVHTNEAEVQRIGALIRHRRTEA